MLKKLRNNSKGFTIIEVMIVLAIAALILLIVLLAVPALQRNSRNTTIKNDASNVAGGISTYESDNNGAVPKLACGTGTVTLAAGGTCGSPTAPTSTAKVNGGTAVQSVTTAPSGVGTASGQIATGTIQVQFGQTCPSSLGGSGQPSTRSAAIFYATETSGAPQLACVDS